MKRFKLISEEMDTIVLRDYCSNPCLRNSDDIICYTTPSGKGTAILIHKDSEYGFVYHRYLLTGYSDNFKYRSDTYKHAIEAAMKGSRTVFLFTSYRDFINYLRTLNQE